MPTLRSQRAALTLLALIAAAATTLTALHLPAAPTALAAGAPQPANHPDAPAPRLGPTTEHDYRQDALAFYQRTLADAYRKRGNRDRLWDPTALQLLDDWALRWAYNDATAVYLPADPLPTQQALTALARQALDAGCDDPLVLYAAGRLFQATDHPDWAAVTFRAGQAMRDSPYPAFHRWAALRHALRIAEQPDRHDFPLPAPALLRIEVDQLFIEAALDPHQPHERRVVFHHLWNQLEGLPTNRRIALLDAIEARLDPQENPDRWIADVLRGEHEVDHAWEIRGNGRANQVDDDAWPKFYEHLERARAALHRAHHAEPQYPEAAARLLSVYMGLRGDHDQQLRACFEDAIAAQIDYIPAWSDYAWSLRPRWHGSHADMYRLGVEALNTGRFDTDVPYRFIDAIQDISNERGDLELWKDPKTWADAQRYFQGNLNEPLRHIDTEYWKTMHAAAAYLAGQFKASRDILLTLDPVAHGHTHLLQHGSRYINDWKHYDIRRGHNAIAEAFARGGPAAHRIQAIEHLALIQDWNAAHNSAHALFHDLDPDDPARAFVGQMRFAFQIMADHQADQPTHLSPNNWLDLWEPFAGQWTATPNPDDHPDPDGVTFTGQSEQRPYTQGLILASRYDFAPRGKLTGTATVQPVNLPNPNQNPDQKPSPTDAANASLLFHLVLNDDSGWFHTIKFQPAFPPKQTDSEPQPNAEPPATPRGLVRVARFWSTPRLERQRRFQPTFDFTFEWYDNRVLVTVDGQRVFTNANLPNRKKLRLQRIGLGAQAPSPGHTVQFSNLQYQPLFTPPPWFDDD